MCDFLTFKQVNFFFYVSDHLFEVLLAGMFIILAIINNQYNRPF